MSELFKEMRKDVEDYPLAREMILVSKKAIYNADPNKVTFSYHFEEHPDLKGKVSLLESKRFIEDTKWNPIDRYRMTDEFVQMLRSMTDV